MDVNTNKNNPLYFIGTPQQPKTQVQTQIELHEKTMLHLISQISPLLPPEAITKLTKDITEIKNSINNEQNTSIDNINKRIEELNNKALKKVSKAVKGKGYDEALIQDKFAAAQLLAKNDMIPKKRSLLERAAYLRECSNIRESLFPFCTCDLRTTIDIGEKILKFKEEFPNLNKEEKNKSFEELKTNLRELLDPPDNQESRLKSSDRGKALVEFNKAFDKFVDDIKIQFPSKR